jgi:hypothetical protein
VEQAMQELVVQLLNRWMPSFNHEQYTSLNDMLPWLQAWMHSFFSQSIPLFPCLTDNYWMK